MTGKLDGRVALVTGASRGIGCATARLFAQEGAQVVLTGRDLAALEQACETISQSVPDASLHPLVLDVAQPDSIKQAFQHIFKQFKRLDVLVSNAGVLEDSLIAMVTLAQIQRTFETNTYGPLLCAQYASRLMARGKSGSIISLSSIMGVNGNSGLSVYAASKAAIIGMTRSLAKELAPQNIRVNAIAPGFINTDMAQALNEDKFAERVESIKMGRVGSADEVAQVALFLASDMSTYVTGQVIGVDGGMTV